MQHDPINGALWWPATQSPQPWAVKRFANSKWEFWPPGTKFPDYVIFSVVSFSSANECAAWVARQS